MHKQSGTPKLHASRIIFYYYKKQQLSQNDVTTRRNMTVYTFTVWHTNRHFIILSQSIFTYFFYLS